MRKMTPDHRRRQELPPIQQADDFDRMCWEVCKFAAGRGVIETRNPDAGSRASVCDCERAGRAACDTVRPTVDKMLQILMRKA